MGLSNFISAGYYITHRVDRPEWAHGDKDLLPEQIVSLSSCPGVSFQVSWGWGEFDPDALAFGVREDTIDELKRWCTEASDIEIGYPNTFYNLQAAQNFVQRFTARDDMGVYGLGLHKSLAATFLSDNIEQAKYGTYQMVSRGVPLQPGGDVLGFEVIGFQYGLAESWLCHGLERDMHEQFGIHPNQHGLLDTYDDAYKVYEWIAEDKQQGTRAEPIPYYPWLVVRYNRLDST